MVRSLALLLAAGLSGCAAAPPRPVYVQQVVYVDSPVRNDVRTVRYPQRHPRVHRHHKRTHHGHPVRPGFRSKKHLHRGETAQR